MREEPQRIGGRLEATLRIPDSEPSAIVVVAHALPTHGGTMRNPLIATIARACAERGWYALRFNFRGVGDSSGTWTEGREEPADVAAAADHARGLAPRLPLGVCGYSFGARMTLRWLELGGAADAVALVGLALRSVTLSPEALPPVPPGTFVVAADGDEFGSAAEVRQSIPQARVATLNGTDHFFRGRYPEVAALVADDFAAAFAAPAPGRVTTANASESDNA